MKAELQPIAVPDDIKDSMVNLIESAGFLDSVAAMIRENGEIFGAYRAVGHGGIAGRAMTALAGKSVEVPSQSLTEMSDALASATRARRPLVACTAGSRYYQQLANKQSIPEAAKPWYVNAHCFTVLGYNPDNATGKLTQAAVAAFKNALQSSVRGVKDVMVALRPGSPSAKSDSPLEKLRFAAIRATSFRFSSSSPEKSRDFFSICRFSMGCPFSRCKPFCCSIETTTSTSRKARGALLFCLPAQFTVHYIMEVERWPKITTS